MTPSDVKDGQLLCKTAVGENRLGVDPVDLIVGPKRVRSGCILVPLPQADASIRRRARS